MFEVLKVRGSWARFLGGKALLAENDLVVESHGLGGASLMFLLCGRLP